MAGPNNRIGRINDDIQLVLSELLRQIKDPRIADLQMISITRVDTTGDLRYAKVYLSIYGEFDEKQLKKGLKSSAGWLRRELGARLSIRYVPELIFEIDYGLEYGAHINSLLSKIIKDEAETESEEISDEGDNG